MNRLHRFFLNTCLSLITTCGLCCAAWAQASNTPSDFPAEAQTLPAEALKARLAGQKFSAQYANGMTANMHFGADQSMQLDLSTGMQAKGTWRVEGSQICFQFGAGAPSGCGESKATATKVFMRRYTNQEVVQFEVLAVGPAPSRPNLRSVFHAVPTDRAGVTMNLAMLEPSKPASKVLLVVAGTEGSEGRIMIQGAMAATSGRLQYLAQHADLFDQAGIALVAMGCPTDQWARFGQCDDDYRSSQQYVDDVSKVMDFLRAQYGWQDFYVFGHSSGGISSRWLSLKMPSQLKGAVNSSVMNGTAGNLARSMLRFDMSAITIPVLNIAHEDDQCPSTPYQTVKRYAKDNLVTVRGGGQSGHICGGANRHSFEGRQRGVSRAIVQWMSSGKVQAVVDSEEAPASASTDVTPHAAPKGFTYINLDTGRTDGLFTKSPVFMRAILLDKPSPQSDTALLFFRGWPGIWRYNENTDARLTSPRGQIVRDVYAKAGLAFVSVDCPTDQWGAEVRPGTVVSGPAPSCLDNYRSSKQHADDVRKVMQVLREQHGIRHFYVQGHSFGTVSSRWLAKHLGTEIDGAIHSASINNPPNARVGYSVAGFDYASLPTPQLHIHHENDACSGTPYGAVKAYAGQNLVTVRGGLAQGDPCGGGHLHSFEGRDQVVAQTIANWIISRQRPPLVGE